MTRASDRHSLTARLLAAAIPAGLALWRWALPQRPLWAVGGAYLLLLAAAIGDRLGKKLWAGTTRLESTVFATAGGMGLLSHGMLLLGLAGLASRGIVVAVIVILGWVFGDSVVHQARVGSKALAQALQGVGRLTRFQKTILALGAATLLAAFILCLVPPTGYDALMYHLLAPRELLERHSLSSGVENGNWHAAGPLGAEMLFALCLAFGSDTAPQLLHLGFAVLVVGATLAAAKRFACEEIAWSALALLLTMPILPIWAGQAQVDFFWALYELLAMYALLLWWNSIQSGRWLVLAGLMSALALGTKYLALAGVVILALLILWRSITAGGRKAAANLTLYLVPALGIALPWYLKNWVWLGNPVYPFFLGGDNLSPQLLSWIEEYHASFGYGEGLWGWLLLPWNLYAHNEAFGAIWNSLDFLSPLFPVILLYPFLWRGKEDRWLDLMLGIAGLHFVLWTTGSRQIRFLLPIVPLLCLAAATTLVRLGKRHWGGLAWRRPIQAVQIAVVIISLAWAGWALFYLDPLPVVLGALSTDGYLREQVGDHAALSYLEEHAPSDTTNIFLIADGRGYYCPQACRPDFSHGAWVDLVESSTGPQEIAQRLWYGGYTHILVSWGDLNFLLQHDPKGRLERSIRFFIEEFEPLYLQEICHGDLASVYQWQAPPSAPGETGLPGK